MTSYTDEQVLEFVLWCERHEMPDVVLSFLRSLHADRTRLQADVESLRTNAERYLWLRKNTEGDFGPTMVWANGWSSEYSGQIICNMYKNIEEYDQAIDTARAAIGDNHE